jgi:hypothetical protein
VATFTRTVAELDQDRVRMSVGTGDNLPVDPLLQHWHRFCGRYQKKGMHINLACIWPMDNTMCLMTIFPRILINATKTRRLRRWDELDDWTLSIREFHERWASAVAVYGTPQHPSR